MSTPPPLHESVGRKFVAAFGEPTQTLGRDWHWALSPVAHVSPINVLLNGSPECPVVWVFGGGDDKHPGQERGRSRGDHRGDRGPREGCRRPLRPGVAVHRRCP
jgi:hypothetical protein